MSACQYILIDAKTRSRNKREDDNIGGKLGAICEHNAVLRKVVDLDAMLDLNSPFSDKVGAALVLP